MISSVLADNVLVHWGFTLNVLPLALVCLPAIIAGKITKSGNFPLFNHIIEWDIREKL